MIGSISILDKHGDIIALRIYRDDFNMADLDTYRFHYIATGEITSVCMLVGDTSFCHRTWKEVFYVASTMKNPDAGVIFEFLSKLPAVIQRVCNLKDLQEDTLKNHAPDIIELLDEMIDSGYPQCTDAESLRLLTQRPSKSLALHANEKRVTVMATGVVSWRMSDIYYARNELYTWVIENVSVLFSATGEKLSALVVGHLIMRSFLSGMPEIKVGFNSGFRLPDTRSSGHLSGENIEVDDASFHQCVRLSNFGDDRAISFIPPDGEFELVRYRKTDNIEIPFEVTPMVRTRNNKTEIRVNLKAAYAPRISANFVDVTIPMPDNASLVKASVSSGKAKFTKDKNVVSWKLYNVSGTANKSIHIEVESLSPSSSVVSPVTRITGSISVRFRIPMFTPSGFTVGYIKVSEKSGYTASQAVQYICGSGKYQIRMI